MTKTWLSPYAAVWKARFPEADVPFGQMARYLKPLIEAHPPERVCAELEGFLAQTEPRYLSLAKFAATFGSWTKPNGPIGLEATPKAVCWMHPDRSAVGEVSRRKVCRECFDA